jgi:diaminopropionate ammonia-lyase
MLVEIDEQLDGHPPDLLVVPVGVGSLAQAVVRHSKSRARQQSPPQQQPPAVLAVEPETAACLWMSLTSGCPTPIATQCTIMTGMNCGTVSSLAWPVLQDGVDACVTVADTEAHDAVMVLQRAGIAAGPCGAAPLAALRRIVGEGDLAALGMGRDSVVVLLCTEGSREYELPVLA